VNKGLDQDEREILLEVNSVILEIDSKMDSEHPQQDPSFHEANNWASEAHHPCDLFLTYARLDWQQRRPLNIDARYRVEDGKRYESMIRRDLEKIGFEVLGNQTRFEWPEFEISGRIDGSLAPRGYSAKLLPFEVKVMGDFLFQKARRARDIYDLINNPIYWINKIPSQLNIYLFLMALPAGILILKTQGVKPRLFPMVINYELAERDLGRLKTVNEHARKKTYPPRMKYNKKVCGNCDFNHVCLPTPSMDFIYIGQDAESYLERYWKLRSQKKEFEKAHAELVGNASAPGYFFGKNALVGDFAITSTESIKDGQKTTRTKIEKMVEGDTPWSLGEKNGKGTHD